MTTETIYMDAVLQPNRSLSPKAFTLVMSIVGLCSFIGGIIYLTVGALPVAGFFGLDALAIWAAFRWNMRAQREATRVRVTAEKIFLHHTAPNGDTKEADVPTAFARVELDPKLAWNDWLRIEYGARAFVIGRFLTPKERKSLADALRTAIRKAQSERYAT